MQPLLISLYLFIKEIFYYKYSHIIQIFFKFQRLKNIQKNFKMKKGYKIQLQQLTTGINFKNFDQGPPIGKGNNTVYLYTNRINPSEKYAVKLLEFKKDDIDCAKIEKEIEGLTTIKEKIPNYHQYFPVFHGYVLYKEKYALIFELADGNLKDLIKLRSSKGLTYKEILSLYRSMSEALSLLQKNDIAHRDLKPENILYFEQKFNHVKFKITDLGEVKLHVSDIGTVRGTPNYLAPELNYSLLNNISFIKKDYDPYRSDVYSAGLILIYAILNDLPFPKKQKNTYSSENKIENAMSINPRRYLEKDLNPKKQRIGPYDDNILEKIEIIKKKFKNEPEIENFLHILKKSLIYQPTNRYDWVKVNEKMKFLLEHVKNLPESESIHSSENSSRKDENSAELKK